MHEKNIGDVDLICVIKSIELEPKIYHMLLSLSFKLFFSFCISAILLCGISFFDQKVVISQNHFFLVNSFPLSTFHYKSHLPVPSNKHNFCMSRKTDNISLDETRGEMLFGKFRISPSQIFFKSSLSAAIVNLRPIVPVCFVSLRAMYLSFLLSCGLMIYPCLCFSF